MNAEIRRATAEDIPHVAPLEQELVRGDAPGDPYLVRDLQRQDVEEQYHTLIASDGAVCLVATHRGEVVGYLSGGWKDSPKWRPVKATEIPALYLREAFRSQGIGRRLIEEFVRWSEERGGRRGGRVRRQHPRRNLLPAGRIPADARAPGAAGGAPPRCARGLAKRIDR